MTLKCESRHFSDDDDDLGWVRARIRIQSVGINDGATTEWIHTLYYTHTHTKKKKKEPRVCVEHPPFFFFGGHTHRQTEKMYNNMHTAHTHTHKKPTNRQSFQHAEVNSLSLSTSSDSLCVLFIPTDDWCIHLFTFSTSINVTLFGKWSPLKLWMCLILTPFDTTSMLVRKENRK